jgi:maltooligosyltrehalose trehalohydrolase
VTRVRVWAPNADRVRVRVGPPGQLQDEGAWTSDLVPEAGGWYAAEVAEATDGRDYAFLLDDDPTLLPDPRSRRQPGGVHGPSRFYPDRFEWTDWAWAGRDLPGSVFYELHIGTFTPDGTLDSAIHRLDHLVELGVTHVELLPVNDFNGPWGWGYDGVLWYAVHEAYGGPDGLKRLVDACHARGLAVTLDVVYNHLGPSGNALPRFGPYLTDGHSPWGELVNLDGGGSGEVRRYIVDNAVMWLTEFHVDALRLDAVHALRDQSDEHVLKELSRRVDALAGELGRPLLLIAESDLNDPDLVTPRARGGFGLSGQWDDDVHHGLHALLTGERQGYYVDFGSLAALAKVLTSAFFYDGTVSTFRGGPYGKPVDRAHTPSDRFVACLQNHDQVGNRAAGERLPELTSAGRLRVGAVLLLTSPFTPLLWMGEEWAASSRWPFFTSHPEPELAEATRLGRIREFADHGWDTSRMADPQAPETFIAAHLDWAEPSRSGHAGMLTIYRDLLRLRRQHPDLGDPRLDRVRVEFDEEEGWIIIHRGPLRVMANLAGRVRQLPVPCAELLFTTDPDSGLAPTGVILQPDSAVVVRAAGDRPDQQ